MTTAVVSPDTSCPVVNARTALIWALTAERRWFSIASSMRAAVRSSTPYARIVAAPTTDSDTAPSSSPTRWRTRVKPAPTIPWKWRRRRNNGTKQTQTTAASGGL